MINKIKEMLKEKYPNLDIEVTIDNRNIVTLKGECEKWHDVVDIGHMVAAPDEIKNVVNELTVKGMTIPKKDYSKFVEKGKNIGKIAEVDVLIIGAGISGCGIAREISKYDLNVMVVDMGSDVATGATKANNGDIHPGHACKPGTLKAKLNVIGNRKYTKWSEELGFELERVGSVMGIEDEKDFPMLQYAYKIAEMNGVDGACIVDGKRALELEPKFKEYGEKPIAALYLPSMGIVEPYKVAVALAENATVNGVKFVFNCTVGDILTENGEIIGAITSKGIIKAKYIINAAGIYADEISAMAGDKSYTIHNRKGTIAIIDKNIAPKYPSMSGVASKEKEEKNTKKDPNSKGGGMCMTPEHNILLGPSANEVPDKEDNATTKEDLDYSMNRNMYDKISRADIIKIFAGARPADYKEDFVIEMSPITHGFINCGAIQSPGLASAPAVAEYVIGILQDDLKKQNKSLVEKTDWNPIRKREVEFRHMSLEEQAKLIEIDPRYGRIICRCEKITEGEILDAIKSPIVPTSIDAIKRRTRAGMGRCQGGFCQPRILELLARELGKEWVEINLNGEGTNVLLQNNRESEK